MSDEVNLRTRRSVRRYASRPVPDELLGDVLDLARCAPSSMDGQPCCFVVIRDSTTKRTIVDLKNAACPASKLAFRADFLVDAPVVVAVCVDRTQAHDRVRENAVLVTGHLLLAAHSRGLAGVYLSAYESHGGPLLAALSSVLGLPETVEPVTLVPLGFPDEAPPPKSLRPLSSLIHFERYGATRS
jgi:nitroreductase